MSLLFTMIVPLTICGVALYGAARRVDCFGGPFVEHDLDLVGGAADTVCGISKVLVFVFYHRQISSID